MKKCCIRCAADAVFVIQWGPNADQKEYVCVEHLVETIEEIKAIEFFVVKIQKLGNP